MHRVRPSRNEVLQVLAGFTEVDALDPLGFDCAYSSSYGGTIERPIVSAAWPFRSATCPLVGCGVLSDVLACRRTKAAQTRSFGRAGDPRASRTGGGDGATGELAFASPPWTWEHGGRGRVFSRQQAAASCSRRFSSMSRQRTRLPSISMNFAWDTSIAGRRHLYLSVGTSEIE